MTAKKRKEIAQEVEKLQAEGQKASQKATELAKLVQETQQTFESLEGETTAEATQTLIQTQHRSRQLVENQHQEQVQQIETVYDNLDDKRDQFDQAIAANQSDIQQLRSLEKQALQFQVDATSLQKAENAKQEEIAFLENLDRGAASTQEQLKAHLDKSRQKRRGTQSNYERRTLAESIPNSDVGTDSNTTEDNLEATSALPSHLVQIVQGLDVILKGSQTIFKDAVSLTTMSISLFTSIATHPNVMRFTYDRIQNAIDVLDFSNKTLGADWSSLPDDSLPKQVAELTEEQEKFHFGNEETAELVNEWADAEEKKNEERRRKSQQSRPNDVPVATAPPKPDKEPSAFAKSLSYGHLRGDYTPSFKQNDHGKLEARFPDGRDTDCYINYSVDQFNRIKITDINVPPNFRRQGVATLLFKDLEERVPDGTVFFFAENQAPDFWHSAGFEFNAATQEFFKVKLDTAK